MGTRIRGGGGVTGVDVEHTKAQLREQVAKALAESIPHIRIEWESLAEHRKEIWRARADSALIPVNAELERLSTSNTIMRGVLNQLHTEGVTTSRAVEDALEQS